MTNIDRIAYCGTCQNSYFDKQIGHLCTKLDPLPNFTNGCEEFINDNDKLSAKLEPIKNKINDSLSARSTLQGKIKNEKGWFEFLLTEVSEQGASYNSKIKLKTTRRKKYISLISSVFFLGFPLALISTDDYSNNIQALIVIGIFFVFGLVSFYHFIINKVVIILDKEGIQVMDKQKINWDHVLYAFFEYDTKGNPRQEFLTLLLHDNTEVRTEVSDLELSKDELGKTIYNYLKKNKTN